MQAVESIPPLFSCTKMSLDKIPPWGIYVWRGNELCATSCSEMREKMDKQWQDDEEYKKEEAADVCACCRHKQTPRPEEERKKLQNRVNRIIGQMNGIRSMLDDNRYCGDILIQIGAVESALQSLGYLILQDHLETCVTQEVQKGNQDIMREAVELIKKIK